MFFSALGPVTTFADNYQAYSERGVEHLGYAKNIIYFSTNGSRVTSSDTDQKQSGFFVNNLGAQKISSLSSSERHTHNFKNKFLAGANVGGVDLGYSEIFLDQGRVYKSGNAYWTMD